MEIKCRLSLKNLDYKRKISRESVERFPELYELGFLLGFSDLASVDITEIKYELEKMFNLLDWTEKRLDAVEEELDAVDEELFDAKNYIAELQVKIKRLRANHIRNNKDSEHERQLIF